MNKKLTELFNICNNQTTFNKMDLMPIYCTTTDTTMTNPATDTDTKRKRK